MVDMSTLNLERFEEYGSRISRKISLHRSASFGIPPMFFKENEIESYEYVQLFFDKLQKVIGIKFFRNESDGGYKINKYGEGEKRAATFIARSFFNKYGIDPVTYHGKYDFIKKEYPNIGIVYLIELIKNVDQDDE